MNRPQKVNRYVTDLSALNLLISFSVSVFSYTIFLFMEENSVPIYYAGLGLSVGQALSILSAIFVGRMNDKGHAFSMMFTGSLIYASGMITIYAIVDEHFLILYLIPVIIAVLIIFEGFFRSSLNVFVSKAVSKEMLGPCFSRINAMELVGSAASFLVLLVSALLNNLGLIYLSAGFLLAFVTLWVFSALHRKERNNLIDELKQTRRPGFVESLRELGTKKRTVSAIVVTKALMTIGTLSFTYFYLLTGSQIGVPLSYLLLILAGAFVLGAVFSKVGEILMTGGMNLGRYNYFYMALNDVLTYGILLAAVYFRSEILILLSVLSSSTNPIFSAGMLSYDVRAIGKENRGMFGAIQRVTIGSFSALIIFPLSIIFLVNGIIVWQVVVVVSLISVITSLLIPKQL